MWCPPHVMSTYGVHMWYPHMVFTCSVHIWHMVSTYGVHMWCPHVVSTYDLPYMIYRIWCSNIWHMVSTYGVHMWCPHMIYRIWFTAYDVHMWFHLKSYGDIQIICGTPHVVCLSVYGVPHMESTFDLARWSNTDPHMIIYGNHMWFACPYVKSTCEHFHIWLHMWTCFPLWWCGMTIQTAITCKTTV